MSAHDVAVLGVGMHPWGKWGKNFVEYGVHAARAALADSGYDAAKLSEGIVGWAGEDLPLEPEGGYVADSGQASAILQAQGKPSHS